MDVHSAPLLPLDIGFGNILWAMVIGFFMVIFLVLLLQVFGDLFRDQDLSGWAKAAWTIFIIVLPFLGLLVYVIARGRGMAERRVADMQRSQEQFNAYVRETAGTGGPAEEIAKAKELLDSGAITQEEFEAIKRKQLA
jgi:ABC-type multidrug transport system fused ATPase/permease subunit